ncbi:MAG TPA: AI-2E family transporter YdiK [Moraxellaceae bacterium]
MTETRFELTRNLLAIIAILLLIAGTLWVLMPFLGALIWAVMIVVSTWPLLLRLQARLGGRRSLAVTVMVVALLLLLFVPLSIAAVTIVEHVDDAAALWARLSQMQPPEPPAWVARLPLVGEQVARTWHNLAVAGSAAMIAFLKPYAGLTLKWLAAQAGSLGLVIVQFLLTVVLAAILYSSGEEAVRRVRGFCRRLAGDAGDRVVILSGAAIRSVAMGIVVTALVQSALGLLGLLVAGVPYAGLLGALVFMSCLIQLGPLIILLPAVGWLFWSGDTVWAVALLVWSLPVGMLDNVLRPWLIRRGADLPLLLIFAGVIGGLFAFGLIGLFVGPVLLAVTYTLLDAWIGDAYPPAAPAVLPGVERGVEPGVEPRS